MTELALIFHKCIPYSAYQVKAVNCRQPIQAPFNYFDKYFHADTASSYFYMARDMA